MQRKSKQDGDRQRGLQYFEYRGCQSNWSIEVTQDSVAYTWEIDGRRALNPDVFYETAQANGFNLERQPLIQIDCPRGARAGKALLLFGKDDAAAIVALEGPQTITVRKWTQSASVDGVMQWNETERYDFHRYYVLSSKDAFGINENSVLVELADPRYLLETTSVRKRYNMVKKKGLDGADYDRDLDTFFPDSIDESVPHEYQDVLDDLLIATDLLPELALDVAGSPRNLFFDCSLADAIDQLLASVGCALTYNPLVDENEFAIAKLNDELDTSLLDNALSEGRLIEKVNSLASSQNQAPSGIRVNPNEPFSFDSGLLLAFPNPVEINIDDTSGSRVVSIRDHEIEPDESRVKTAVMSWYAPLTNSRDETYQGILRQRTASAINRVRWSFTDGQTSTLVQNLLQGEIPWPVQALNVKPPSIRYWGKVSADIGPGSGGTLTIWNPLTNTATDETLEVRNIGPTAVTDDDDLIGVSKDGLSGAWIIDTKFCAAE